MTPQPEPCANYHTTRRHLSINLAPKRHGAGREGKSLCAPGGFPVDVYDAEAIDAIRRQFAYGKEIKPADIPALQACKNCERKAAKMKENQP